MVICIIDDHLLFGQALKGLIAGRYPEYDVRVFASSREFLKDNAHPHPSLVITDLFIPGLNGLDMMAAYKEQHPDCRFIFISSSNDTAKVRECLKKGASAYLSKDASEDELADAVATVLQGGKYLNSTMKDRWVNNIFSDEETVLFSPRETEVLQKLCNGLTPKEIAFEMGLTLNTVQQYIKSMMQKTKLNRTTELVLYAVQKGIYIVNRDVG
ncbi:response regulator transcription factor [Foetidibacter luteolus]|uniref:response regulator transcription factor n=1 Tax=Foetidibacter luteolus TaxID=2608880 RepID=UPI00129A7F3E|nr:response regulator transcription factor [Foetidibacter luteolus]